MLLNKILAVLLAVVFLLFAIPGFSKVDPLSVSQTQEENEEQKQNPVSFRKGTTFIEEEEQEEQEGQSSEEITEEETDPENTLLYINGTDQHYYYPLLTEEEKLFYDGYERAARNAHVEGYSTSIFTTMDPSQEECWKIRDKAYEALFMDHPEYFGFFRKTNTKCTYYLSPNSQGQYQIDLRIESPYREYEEEMTAFNTAVDNFLAGIDRTQRPEQIALAVHDRMMDIVEYDYAALEDPEKKDLYVFSAYGVLVKNMKGQDNLAVCEGYAQAYEYLCQLCGLDVTIVHGDAGGSLEDLGSHAWNLIKLDGDWYELDVTWDDNVGSRAKTTQGEGDYREMTNAMNADTAFYNKVSHTYFLMTTDAMAHRAPAENACKFDYQNGWWSVCSDEDYHIRWGTDQQPTADLTPTAYGAYYTYDTIIAE